LHWWINNHRHYFDKIQVATGKKMMYYGGYALNVLLGSVKGGAHVGADDMYFYTRGKDIIGEEASDIDIKLMGVDTDKSYKKAEQETAEQETAEKKTAEKVLQAIHIFSGHPAAGIVTYDMFGDPGIHRVALEITSNKPYVIVEAHPGILQRPGLKYIIAHNRQYINQDIDRGTLRWQVIITGILKNDTPQTLSEITMTNEAARLPPGVPNVPGIYGTYSGSELCTQFIRQFDDIKHKGDKARIIKTLKRIAHCIVYQIETHAQITPGQHAFLVEILGQGGKPANKEYGKHMKKAVNEGVYNIIKTYLMEKGVDVQEGGRRQRKSVKARRASFKDNRRGNGRRSSRSPH
jgi:hypothetical protein